MENEKSEAEVATSTVAPAQTTEANKDQPPVDVAAIQSELAQARQDLTKWQNEAKAHQKTASKKSEEAQRWQGEVTGINARIDALAEILEETLTRPTATDEMGETPKVPVKTATFKERLQTKIQAIPKPVDPHIGEVGTEIAAIEKNSGVDFMKMEDDRVRTYWAAGNVDRALSIAKEIELKMAESKEQKAVDPKDKELADAKAEIARLKKIASGELDVEKGQPRGGTRSFQDIEKGYNEGTVSRAEYNEARRKRGLS